MPLVDFVDVCKHGRLLDEPCAPCDEEYERQYLAAHAPDEDEGV